MAASVHRRLLDRARESLRPFNEVLQHFAIERFIYRLSISPYANKFILKGALMFPLWTGPSSRSTLDIDLLGKIDNSTETIMAVIKKVCDMKVEDDGMHFDSKTLSAHKITEDADYGGVRVRIQARLGNAKISLQIDIGFGDKIVPAPRRVKYPVILDFPAPALNGYTMESTIAEKYQAMVKLGVANSRMKDFYDIWFLCRRFDFNGEVLAEAIATTFVNRKTPITPGPAVFNPSFAVDPAKKAQWQGFIRKAQLDDPPEDFEDVIATISEFLKPLVTALAEKSSFTATWSASRTWEGE